MMSIFVSLHSSYAERASNMVNLVEENLNNVTDLHKRVNISFSTLQQDIADLQDDVDAVSIISIKH